MTNDPIYYVPGAVQTVAYTGTAAASSAVGAQTYFVRLVATTACFVLCTLDGTAATTATGFYLPAGVPEIIKIPPTSKISVIRAASDGSLYVTELSR